MRRMNIGCEINVQKGILANFNKRVSGVQYIFGNTKVKSKELITSAMIFHPLFYGALALRSADFQKKSGWNVMADVIGSFNFILAQHKLCNLICEKIAKSILKID